MPRVDSNRFEQIRPHPSQKLPKSRQSAAYPRNDDGEVPDMQVPGALRGLRMRGKGPTFRFLKEWRGKRFNLSLGPNFAQAQMQAQSIQNAMDRGDFSLSAFQQERTTIGDFFSTVVEALRVSGDLAPRSVASYRSRVDHFLKYLHAKHPTIHFLADVTSSVAHGFVEWRRQQKVSRSGKALPGTLTNFPAPQTVHDDVRRLRTIFKVAVEKDLLKANPFDKVKIKKKANDGNESLRSLTPQQARLLLKAAGEYDRASNGEGGQSTFRGMFRDMLHFYLVTGLRKEELIYLPWKHVELDQGKHGAIIIKKFELPIELLVYPNVPQVSKMRALVKGRPADQPLFSSVQQLETVVPLNYANQEESALMKLRVRDWDDASGFLRLPTTVAWKQKGKPGTVPLCAAARAILNRQMKRTRLDSPFVFAHPWDRGPLRSDPLPVFKQILKAAKLPTHFHLHDLRRSFGVNLRRLGVPLETLMGLMRHANYEETLLYAPYSPKEGAQAIEKLDAVGF